MQIPCLIDIGLKLDLSLVGVDFNVKILTDFPVTLGFVIFRIPLVNGVNVFFPSETANHRVLAGAVLAQCGEDFGTSLRSVGKVSALAFFAPKPTPLATGTDIVELERGEVQAGESAPIPVSLFLPVLVEVLFQRVVLLARCAGDGHFRNDGDGIGIQTHTDGTEFLGLIHDSPPAFHLSLRIQHIANILKDVAHIAVVLNARHHRNTIHENLVGSPQDFVLPGLFVPAGDGLIVPANIHGECPFALAVLVGFLVAGEGVLDGLKDLAGGLLVVHSVFDWLHLLYANPVPLLRDLGDFLSVIFQNPLQHLFGMPDDAKRRDSLAESLVGFQLIVFGRILKPALIVELDGDSVTDSQSITDKDSNPSHSRTRTYEIKSLGRDTLNLFGFIVGVIREQENVVFVLVTEIHANGVCQRVFVADCLIVLPVQQVDVFPDFVVVLAHNLGFSYTNANPVPKRISA